LSQTKLGFCNRRQHYQRSGVNSTQLQLAMVSAAAFGLPCRLLVIVVHERFGAVKAVGACTAPLWMVPSTPALKCGEMITDLLVTCNSVTRQSSITLPFFIPYCPSHLFFLN